MAPIRYYDFWDVPRAFVTADDQRAFLLECSFDEQLDDFPDRYEVYEMPQLDVATLPASWCELAERKGRFLGRVEVSKVRFDSTRRQEVDLEGIRQLLVEK